jgi:hypothetical protein
MGYMEWISWAELQVDFKNINLPYIKENKLTFHLMKNLLLDFFAYTVRLPKVSNDKQNDFWHIIHFGTCKGF